MQPLLDIPMYAQSWQDQGSNFLTDGDMEAAGVASWTALNASLSKQTASPHSGSQWLRVVATGAVCGAGQTGVPGLLLVNRRFHFVGWQRYVSGATLAQVRLGSGATVWNSGTMSGAWEPMDKVVVTANNENPYYGNFAANVNDTYGYDDQSIYEQFLYTANRGLLAQTPATSRVQLGDGRSAPTFPTMANLLTTPRLGMSMDGGDHMLWNAAVIPSSTYTVCMLVERTNVGGGAQYLFDARAGGGTGYMLDNGGGVINVSGGSSCVNDAFGGSGSLTLQYGQLMFVAFVGGTISAPTSVTFFASNALAFPFTGKCFGIRLYPGTLTSQQLRDVRVRMMSEVWT